MAIKEQIELIDKFRNDMYYYWKAGASAVYLGTNNCTVLDGPTKGIQMLSCISFDPKFRDLSKKYNFQIHIFTLSLGAMLDITSTIVNSLEEEVKTKTENLVLEVKSQQKFLFILFILFLVFYLGLMLIPFIIISEIKVRISFSSFNSSFFQECLILI